MKIKILNIYPKLMNLYGERGNMLVLEKRLKEAGCEVVIDSKQLGEELSFEDYDMVYMGCGTESASFAALEALRPYKKEMENYIESGKILLLTGNAGELFGKTISTDGNDVEGLGIFTYTAQRTTSKRYLGDTVCTYSLFREKIIGFVNKCSMLSGVASPLFNVEIGLGNDNNKTTEGFSCGNVFVTSLIGPILVRNPAFLLYIMSLLFEQKGEKLELENVTKMELQWSSYQQSLRNIEENLGVK